MMRAVQRLGHYYLLNLLGSGSSGSVYRAQDSRHGRTVALKVLNPSSKDAIKQFERELAVSRDLQHEAIVPVESLTSLDDGRLLLVTPYLEGKTFDKVLVPLDVQAAVSSVRQVALGLEHAHNKGILHCDIKPANLVQVAGQVKILDFGLARFLGEAAEANLGTLEYRAPEVVRGQAATAQSDLWALGVVFYELLTAVSPFRADSETATLRRIAAQQPAPVGALRPNLPAGLNRIIARLLAKRPINRYRSASDLVKDLDALQAEPAAVSQVTASSVTVTLSENPLVGRHDERALIALYLQDPNCRLLNLHGMGGIGKTSLAHAALQDQETLKRFGEHYFVSFASATDLLSTLVEALGVEVGLPSLDALTTRFSVPTLLVLDNLEHLKQQLNVLETLLLRCPRLTLLTTSRERLGLESEWVLPVRGLTYSKNGTSGASFPAAELFVQAVRTSLDSPGLKPDDETVQRITQQLQGHPLGLKLVACWLGQMTVQDALQRLKKSGLDPSLASLFAQSLALLPNAQQALYLQLGVFAGSFDLQAARAILNCQAQTLASFMDAALLERSLDGRYNLHPLSRAFVGQLFTARTDQQVVKTRYRRYYLRQLRNWDSELLGGKQAKVIAKLEQEQANVAAALRLTKVQPETAEPLRIFYTQKGRYADGYTLFATGSGIHARACCAWFALLKGDTKRARVAFDLKEVFDLRTCLLVYNLRAGLAWQQGSMAEGERLSLAALELAKRVNDVPTMTAVQANLGLISEGLGKAADAAAYYQASLSLAETTANTGTILVNLNNLAALYIAQARFAAARPLLEKGLLLSEKSRLERLKPLLQSNLGLCLYAEGDLDNARLAYQEAASVLGQRGQMAAAATVEGYLAQTYAGGEPTRARTLLRRAFERARQAADEQSCLSIIVRYAEVLAQTAPEQASSLAALVAAHSSSDPGDRRLAETLTSKDVSALSLDEAARILTA